MLPASGAADSGGEAALRAVGQPKFDSLLAHLDCLLVLTVLGQKSRTVLKRRKPCQDAEVAHQGRSKMVEFLNVLKPGLPRKLPHP
jgi:hypothetical protein